MRKVTEGRQTLCRCCRCGAVLGGPAVKSPEDPSLWQRASKKDLCLNNGVDKMNKWQWTTLIRTSLHGSFKCSLPEKWLSPRISIIFKFCVIGMIVQRPLILFLVHQGLQSLVVLVSHAGRSKQEHCGLRCGHVHFHFLSLWCSGSRCKRPMKDEGGLKRWVRSVYCSYSSLCTEHCCFSVCKGHQSQQWWNDEQN